MLGLLAFSAIFPIHAHADENEPFQLDTGKWMSFKRYTSGEKPPEAVKAPEATNEDASQGFKTQTTATVEPAKAPVAETKIATPSRPIDLPVMPGMNKGFNVQVQSTEDEDTRQIALANPTTDPDLDIKDKNWQKPQEATKEANADAADKDTPDGHQKLDVRLSYLPDPKVSPEWNTPVHHRVRTAEAPEAVAVAEKPAPVKKSPQELAACAAIDAYKKRQLNAIQSDRQTLVALQSAIAELGLQKQLSFMTDVQGNLNTQGTAAGDKAGLPATAQP